ncbi:hypothetical protein MXD81_51565 [Microbacteriaceae bacterium K1510]|nr:hypothetical protein [Microbacteriaceae bacterium K1510]
MTAAIGSSTAGSTTAAYTATNTTAADTSSSTTSDSDSSRDSDTVTLSDSAKAYLATTTTADTPDLATQARAWFDAQYHTLGIASPLIDGQVAVDFTGQSRETLAAVAANAKGLFSVDEQKAAAQALQSRFESAMASHVVLARHTGDYASLYQAASDYLNAAGADERSTVTWKLQSQVLAEGLTAASKSWGKAPDTGNADDPISALLDKTTQSTTSSDSSNPASLIAKAREMLDAQANKARDKGTELVFDKGRRVGTQADFSQFDNQSLALVALNQDGSFSTEEARAARKELDQRNRATLMNAFDPSNGGGVAGASLALLSLYSGMSAAEKAALGYGDRMQNQIVQSYRTISMLQQSTANSSSSGSTATPSLSSYF